MGTRNATFVQCDRCSGESEHASPEIANRQTMQLQITGEKRLYAPHHETGERSYLCNECAESFRDWWRSPRSLKASGDKE